MDAAAREAVEAFLGGCQAAFEAGRVRGTTVTGGVECLEVRFDLPEGGTFRLEARPLGGPGHPGGQAYLGLLWSLEEPLEVVGRKLSDWRLLRGWRHAADPGPVWHGDAAALAAEGIEAARRWADLRARQGGAPASA